MIKVENVEVFGWEAAIRGMRNPMNSWAKSDSCFKCNEIQCENCLNYNKRVLTEDGWKCDELAIFLGENDLDLMQRLYKGGTEHRKYLRMIHVQMDITAPLYWWKEFDTYKVGTTANSCSTMHKIHAKEFTLDDFSCEHIDSFSEIEGDETIWHYDNELFFYSIIRRLNIMREKYLETKDKKYWWQMIQFLPSSYNQRRTVDFSYETAVNIIKQRSGHKLDEWNEFVKILLGLPYIKEIMEVRYETDRC